MILHGDCLDKLKELDENSIDCLITDPPYGIKFMGKCWDDALPSIDIWKECHRVMKPGSFGFICCIPRQDCLSRMIVSLEDAGFQINFSSMYWTYSTGFPKSMNIGKKIDKRLGMDGSYAGFQPKPAVEVIIVVMKPLSESGYLAQAMKDGKGVTWFDDCRVPYSEDDNIDFDKDFKYSDILQSYDPNVSEKEKYIKGITKEYKPGGRFPANLLISDDILGRDKITSSKGGYDHFIGQKFKKDTMVDLMQKIKEPQGVMGDVGTYSRFFDLDKWAQKNLPFLITPKPPKSERNAGCEELGNNHPTIKPMKLMSYLITLGSREGDIILDPFSGSGTTACSSIMLRRNFIAIEKEEEYIKIIKSRVEYYKEKIKLQPLEI